MTDDYTKNNTPMPLEGIKVVEYGVFHAGPGGSAILGDLGADIIKIETATGAPERYWIKVANLGLALPNGESLLHEVSSRNKKSICIDIKTENGIEILHRLVKDADVFLSNLRKSTKVKLGIDYDTLKSINPRLIYANVSGYGPKGPMSDLGGWDPHGQAISGLMYTTGTSEPVLSHLAILDQCTAIAVSHAIITALFVRDRRGISQEVHVSLFGTALWMQYINFMAVSMLNIDPCVPESRAEHSPLRTSFLCKDGQWIIGTHHPEEKYWAAFCRLTGCSNLIKDKRFTDDGGRPIPSIELMERFDRAFVTKTRDEWMEIFVAEGLMFCPVKHIKEIATDIQALANNYVVPFEHPMLGKINIPGYPVHFSECRAGTRSSAPAVVGEHTSEIMQRLGYSAEKIAAFKAEGVI